MLLDHEKQPDRKAWFAVTAIALGAFAMVITEFLPIGLLPEIYQSFGISEGTSGLMVTATGLVAAIAAPLIILAAGRLDRRIVLLALTGFLILSSALSAFAANFIVMLLARILLGINVGGFWAVALAAGTRLAPEGRTARAGAIIMGAVSAAAVVSVPAGTYIGAHFDWRVAFKISSFLAGVVFFIQWVLLPRLPIGQKVKLKDMWDLFQVDKTRVVFVASLLLIGGHFAAYTYITPFLQQVSGFSAEQLSLFLLIYGIAGIAGNFIAGLAAEHSLRQTLIINGLLFSAFLGIMAYWGQITWISVTALTGWAFAWGMAPLCLMLWLLRSAPHAPEAAQAMNTTVFQFAVSLGSLSGGVIVDAIHITSVIWFGAILVTITLGLIIIFVRDKNIK
jgi:predicted MFS family arabinose efflux permease